MDYSKLLAQTSVFTHLSQGEIEAIVALGVTKPYRAGEWIAYQGDIWSYLFVVICGEVVAVKESAEGRSLILEQIGKGEIFWGLGFFLDQAPMPAGLRASQDCELLLWSQERLSPVLMQDSGLSWQLSRMVLQRAWRASDIVDGLAFQPVAGRLARFLLERFEDQDGEPISRNLTLDEMAAHIGSTREMISRILHRFANEGMIEITRTEFAFTDRASLIQVAQKFND